MLLACLPLIFTAGGSLEHTLIDLQMCRTLQITVVAARSLLVPTCKPGFLLYPVVLTKYMIATIMASHSAYASAGGFASEVLSAIRTVCAFGGEERAAEGYK